jgi:hypothetical protein
MDLRMDGFPSDSLACVADVVRQADPGLRQKNRGAPSPASLLEITSHKLLCQKMFAP